MKKKKRCFATSLATQFLNYIGHLQLAIFICYECYRTSCKSRKSCNSPYIWCNSLQLNYNFVTTHFQLLCNSPMIHNVMLTSFFIHTSKFSTWHYEDFSWFFWNIDIHRPLWLFVLDGLGLWHMAQSKVVMWHINWILKINICVPR
jgi:hypothetical protein